MKLVLENKLYRVLSISRFFNAFGASIFNLVFVVYASTLPNSSIAVAGANIVMLVPSLFTIFVGIKADKTQNKARWMIISGFLQALLFFIGAFVLNAPALLAFSSLCLINIISDIISDFAGGLRMPIIQEKVKEDSLMTAYSFSQFLTYISAIGGQAFGVWLLSISQTNFFIVALINSLFFLLSSLVLLKFNSELTIKTQKNNSDGQPLKKELSNIYLNLKTVFLQDGQQNFGFMLSGVLLINSLGGAIGAIYNIFLLNQPLFSFSYSESLFIVEFILVVAVVISSLIPNDYFGRQSLSHLMVWSSLGLILTGVSNVFDYTFLGLLGLGFTMYISGKVSPKIGSLLMQNLDPDVLARTSNFLGLLFTLATPLGTVVFSVLSVWNIRLTWFIFGVVAICALILSFSKTKTAIRG